MVDLINIEEIQKLLEEYIPTMRRSKHWKARKLRAIARIRKRKKNKR